MLLVVGFVLIMTGSIQARECNYDEFGVCMRDVIGLEGNDFSIINEEQMKEVCNSKRQTIRCASDFIQTCMRAGERDLYEATTGGKLKVVEEMCTDGSHINNGFVQNMGCFRKLQDEIGFCNDKFKESQSLLDKSNMIDRLKVFYGCCAFEWHRNCLAKAAKMKCNDEASEFMYYVSTVLGGQVQNKICSTSYSSCHGLHGVSQEEIDEKLENIANSEEEEDSENIDSSAMSFRYSTMNAVLFLASICFTWIYEKTAFFVDEH